MTRNRLALAAALAGVLAGPALAQTAQPAPAVQPPSVLAPTETAPAAPVEKVAPDAQTTVPDTGMKKTQTAHVHHKVHHHVHAKAADTSTPPAATRR